MPDAVRDWVRHETGAAVARVHRLPGASSTAVHDLVLSDGTRCVLRRYVWRSYREAEPDAPVREVDALRLARGNALPVPELLAADVDGSAVGDGVPAILMSRIPGRAVAVPDLHRLAQLAASVHGVAGASFPHAYFPWRHGTTTSVPVAATRPELWEAALEVWFGDPPPEPGRFVHRDFHPGNVLWLRGAVSGVVDWTAACRGPAGVDVAHCRSNLIRLSGIDAADAFLRAYESLTGVRHHPYWEIASVLEHDASDWTADGAAAAERRLETALGALG